MSAQDSLPAESTTPPDELELFNVLLRHTPDQIYFKDREGRFLRISDAVARCLGANDWAEVIGKSDFDFWSEETARAARADEEHVMATGEVVDGKIERLVAPDGTVTWAYTTKMPLRNAQGEIIGICGINKDFTKQKELADALAAEHERLRVLTAELQARNAQIEADLQMARKVQEALLPHDYTSVSHTGGFARNALSFTHCYLPAAAVGGDFFHIFPLPHDRVGIFICDVMGHGLRAALVTAIIRALLEELRPQALGPALFMSELNQRVRAILEHVDEPFVATAFYAIVDPTRSKVTFANAAHPPAVRLHKDEGIVGILQEDGHAGPALGLLDNSVYRNASCPFMPDERLVFFTDGAFEVDSPEGEEFGQAALRTGIAKHSNLPASELFAAVLEDVKRFAEKREFADDVCLVSCDHLATTACDR